MDTSISKALIMVASVLLAMLVIAFMVHSFMQVGNWATTQDDELLTEQKDKFNKEYEVYDKNLMYGVDVISCLNKAYSNNEKIRNNRVINGETYDETYEVQVKVTLKENSPLTESMTVYYMKDGKEGKYEPDNGPNNVKIEDVGFDFLKSTSGDSYAEKISGFKGNDSLKTVLTSECKKIDSITEFGITKYGNAENEEELRALLDVSNTISQTVKNPNKTDSGKEESWTKAEFRSALYDLKTRKFRCTNLTYSDSGRVNRIEFTEI